SNLKIFFGSFYNFTKLTQSYISYIVEQNELSLKQPLFQQIKKPILPNLVDLLKNVKSKMLINTYRISNYLINIFEESEQHDQEYKTKCLEHRVHRYFLLNLKQIGRKQRRKRPSTSIA
ncbi:hypothetical protein AABB24_032543, partial [Solanum stoloniferum]